MHFFILLLSICLIGKCTEYGATSADAETSISDQAASSAAVRQDLISAYESAPATFKDDRLFAVALSYILETNYERGKSIYDSILLVDPDSKRALRNRGFISLKQQNLAEAIPYLKKAWSLGDLDSLPPLAMAYVDTGQFDEAERLLPALREHISDQAIANCLFAYGLEINPPNEEIILEAINAIPDKNFMTDGQTAQIVSAAFRHFNYYKSEDATVRAICNKIIREYTANPAEWPTNYFSALGMAYWDVNGQAHAERYFAEAIRVNPDDSTALAGLGRIDLFRDDYTNAVRYLRRAWLLGETTILANLVAAYVAERDFVGAKDLVPDMLAHRSDNMEVLNSLLAYALYDEPPDKQLFYKALDGISDDKILGRPDTTDAVLRALNHFGDDEHYQKLLKLKEEHDKARTK